MDRRKRDRRTDSWVKRRQDWRRWITLQYFAEINWISFHLALMLQPLRRTVGNCSSCLHKSINYSIFWFCLFLSYRTLVCKFIRASQQPFYTSHAFSGRFPSVCSLKTNVSEHSIWYIIFAYEDGADRVFRNVGF